MYKLFQEFRRTEKGAVTVDWVILTAMCLTFLLAVFKTIGGETTAAYESTSELIVNNTTLD
ncbi:MAG: hypothetical protein FH759_01000 [Sediminimonas qiaohouensis]|uniref:Pilus assembly protein n=1 Tax=Sediminimonas qiaohouensis TaxID=552061 RepID=A0A7C9LQ28_9RHOB|nr:hypothetical protein [Sediminimonas qiaohouensis]MTJ03256.1 hypothetical protein [Sediminimonas qiaohouensis]